MAVFDNILFSVKDFASSKVATAPSPADTGTSLSVTAGEGTLFPTPSTDGVFRAYVWPDAVEPDATNCEEIEITVKSTDDFTIVRSKNGIVRSILIGDNIAINFGKSKEDQVLNILKDGRIEDKLLPSQSFTRDSDTQFKTPDDKTDYYTAGRIVLVNDSGVTTSHIVISSSYSSPNTTVIISGTALPASLDNIYIAIQPKDGTSPGVGVISNIKSEVPSGTIDGSNTDFTIANTPVTGTLMVYLNGIRQKITDDYTFTGTTISFITAPLTDSKILVDYDINAGNYATGSASFIDNETPTGLVNSSNTTFTLISAPITGSLMLFRDGQLLTGGGADYTLTTNSIEFVSAPTTGSVLLAFYQSIASTVGNADLLDGQHAPTGTIVGTTDIQTLIGKTLTSPKINEDVALTTTATELNNLHSKTLGLDAWSTWNPTTAGITKGSATYYCKYIQIGKFVHCRISFKLSADSAITGTVTFSLPVTAKTYDNSAGVHVVGLGVVWDSNVTDYQALIKFASTTTVVIQPIIVSGTHLTTENISSTVPFTWTTNDQIELDFSYEAA